MISASAGVSLRVGMRVWVQRIDDSGVKFLIRSSGDEMIVATDLTAETRQDNESLHRIHQRRKPLNAHLQSVARFDGPDAAGRACQDHVTRLERHIDRYEAHEMVAIEDELARI